MSASHQNLRVITLAQVSLAVKGSSYDYEESTPLPVDFLQEAREKAKEKSFQRFEDSLEELMKNPVRQVTHEDIAKLGGPFEKTVIYDMAGAVIKSVLTSGSTLCNTCLDAVKWTGAVPHEKSTLTETKEFFILKSSSREDKTQISVSDAVYRAILIAKITFRLYHERTISFKSTDVRQYFVENLMYVWGSDKCTERSVLQDHGNSP